MAQRKARALVKHFRVEMLQTLRQGSKGLLAETDKKILQALQGKMPKQASDTLRRHYKGQAKGAVMVSRKGKLRGWCADA